MAKRIFILIAALSLSFAANAQVFNTGKTLKSGGWSFGIEPTLLIRNSYEDFNLFIHGGYGITSGVDFGLKAGFLGDESYFGGDVEFGIGRAFSLAVGAHHYGEFGLDACLLGTIDARKGFDVYLGLDVDAIFTEPEVTFPVWLPLGVEIFLRNRTSFMFEAEIGLNDPAYHVIGGGVNFYF